uniref:trypsin n=1 Tax=Acanthochromis polyacanthus TaxID=80966 RepID=A0A3Q1H018_9TELE
MRSCILHIEMDMFFSPLLPAYAGKIFGGHVVVPHSRPYMALLERTMSDGKTKYCGGFLLSEDFVMTAAHCQAKSYTVILGAHNMKKNEKRQKITVEQTFPHKDYDEKRYINDIMLLKLSSKANFSETVKPIALPPSNYGSLPKSCSISGWGRTNRSNQYLSSILMEVSVELINDDKCTEGNMYCSKGEKGPGEVRDMCKQTLLINDNCFTVDLNPTLCISGRLWWSTGL